MWASVLTLYYMVKGVHLFYNDKDVFNPNRYKVYKPFEEFIINRLRKCSDGDWVDYPAVIENSAKHKIKKKRKHEAVDPSEPKQKRIVKRRNYNFINGSHFVIDDTKFLQSTTGESFFETYKITDYIAKGGNGVVCKGKFYNCVQEKVLLIKRLFNL